MILQSSSPRTRSCNGTRWSITSAAHWRQVATIVLFFLLRVGPAGAFLNAKNQNQQPIAQSLCSYTGAHASAVEVLHRYQPPQTGSNSSHAARDAGGNIVLADNGPLFKEMLTAELKAAGQGCKVAYIDPSYMVRSVAADTKDSHMCYLLASQVLHMLLHAHLI
jgi:hypothetical protein